MSARLNNCARCAHRFIFPQYNASFKVKVHLADVNRIISIIYLRRVSGQFKVNRGGLFTRKEPRHNINASSRLSEEIIHRVDLVSTWKKKQPERENLCKLFTSELIPALVCIKIEFADFSASWNVFCFILCHFIIHNMMYYFSQLWDTELYPDHVNRLCPPAMSGKCSPQANMHVSLSMTKLLPTCCYLIRRRIHPVRDSIISVSHLHSLCMIRFHSGAKKRWKWQPSVKGLHADVMFRSMPSV